ncbi:MAG: hypothetical protein CVU84_05295 [Firmicutes bacterium HGW-Firmicutes-1]|jgi:GntR family transcriptional regulator/MocR family aminotransferase|nr:MAG: hypothetical protein CVU84_05295 [Firmicutes bacterium HGW-Firmicutes-1]
MELTPLINYQDKVPMFMQLYQYMKNEIISNRLTVNDQLPSVRKLSSHLGISRTTVENAYQQLLAEGYIYSMPQRGYYVNQLEGIFTQTTKKNVNFLQNQEEMHSYVYDFKSEYVEEKNFDFNNWKKHLNFIINYQQEKLYTFGSVQGEEALIQAIVKYVHRTRGVNASESNIIIGAGVQPLLNILSLILKKDNIHEIAMEDPGFSRAKDVFLDNNIKILPLEVNEKGIHIKQLENMNTRLCYVSPSHQFPTGTVMLIDTRSKLLKWANENKGYIIEDDYNSELRYEGKPIPAMQGLDQHDRVIYLGSFSTVLVPAIRISFMILPDELMNCYHKDKNKYAQTASKLEQLALANMMDTGDFEKHIRKIRINYSKKNEYTIKCIESTLQGKVEIVGMNSGLNILLKLKSNKDERLIIEKLKKEGVHIAGISEYRMQLAKNDNPILILSFRGIDQDKIKEGIIKISNILDT